MNAFPVISDDSSSGLDGLTELLGPEGHGVVPAGESGCMAVIGLPARPELVLLDATGPETDAFAQCRRLKADRATAEVPVLLLVPAGEPEGKALAFAAGASDILTVPLVPAEALARVRTLLALQRTRRELAGELAIKERFMRIAGHDLRNPVCLILIAADLARRGDGLPEEVRERLDSIGDSAAQIRRIIDTFLTLRVAGKDGGGRVDLAILAAAAVRQHAPAAERKSIRLGFEPPAGRLPLAACDPTLIYQVLANLLSNALKFTPAGGEVAVAVTMADDRLRFEVRDSGPGVPADERARLFTENPRLTPQPTGGEESHGYGLAIVKQLIESQGGTVGADFPATGGSVFWCAVPALPGE